MFQHDHDHTAAAVAPRKFLPSKAEFDRLGLGHSTRIVWIRGRQYFLDATVDPVTHDVLSYRLRGGPASAGLSAQNRGLARQPRRPRRRSFRTSPFSADPPSSNFTRRA